ncbi:Uncharacterised protein [Vibrio cholerae]|nr:Uncharacterised protein [Vibrio cholerae]
MPSSLPTARMTQWVTNGWHLPQPVFGLSPVYFLSLPRNTSALLLIAAGVWGVPPSS